MPSLSKVGKWRRRLQLVLWVALGFMILIAVGAGLTWYSLERTAAEGKKELAAAIAETDALDPRWRWEEIQEDLPPIPDSENSMRVISQLADSLKDWNPAELLLSDGNEVLEDWAANRQLDEEGITLIRDVREKRERSLALGISLRDYPHGRKTIELSPDLLNTSLEHAQHCRLVYSLMGVDIEELLSQKQVEPVPERIRSILHASAALRDDLNLVSQLVRMAGRGVAVRETERLLGMAEVEDSDLRHLVGYFEAEQNENLMLTGVRGERAGWHFVYENIHSGRLSFAEFLARTRGNSGSKPELSLRVAGFLGEPTLYEDHAYMLRWINEAWKIAQLPAPQQSSAWRRHEDDFRTGSGDIHPPRWRPISFFFMPSFRKIGEASLRDQSRLSCVIAALAAERFRLAHKRWPNDLQELCPTYLKEVPIDPFDGKPLKLAQRDDGIVIYSVDKDGNDDGGDIHKQSPEDDDPKDLGVRLWNPDHRRLPPEPKKKDQPHDDDP